MQSPTEGAGEVANTSQGSTEDTEMHWVITCRTCKRGFDDDSSLQNHLLSHTDRPRYMCPTSDKVFTYHTSFKTYLAHHASDTAYQCQLCQRHFSSARALKRHSFTHPDQDIPPPCINFVSKVRSQVVSVSEGKEKVEEKLQAKTCIRSPSCQNRLPGKAHANESEESVDCWKVRRKSGRETDTPVNCPVCGATVSRARNLKIHMRKHTGEKPFICSVCNKAFRHRASYRLHLKHKCCSSCDSGREPVVKEEPHLPVHCGQGTEGSGQDDTSLCNRPGWTGGIEGEKTQGTTAAAGKGENCKDRDLQKSSHLGEESLGLTSLNQPVSDSCALQCGSGKESNTQLDKQCPMSQVHPHTFQTDHFVSPEGLKGSHSPNLGETKLHSPSLPTCESALYQVEVRKSILHQNEGMEPSLMHQEGVTEPSILCQQGVGESSMLCQEGVRESSALRQEGVLIPSMQHHEEDSGDPLQLFTHRPRGCRPLNPSQCVSCPECGVRISRQRDLKIHMRIHSGEKPYLCSQCGEHFRQAAGLVAHNLRKHSSQRPFVCDQCGASFPLVGSLNQHMRIHNEVKGYTCDKCGKSFLRSSDLQGHLARHLGIKRFGCEVCHKKFCTASELAKHKNLHTGETPFVCTECRRAFRLRKSLKRHLHTHLRHR